MKDTIIKGNGNSRFLKSIADFKTIYPTYDAFAAALAAGTLPIDLNGINPDGMTQVGTALSKGTLLTDETALKLDLDPDTATPADVLNLLLAPQIISNTEPGMAITASCGETIVTGTANESGQCVLHVPIYGTWTITVGVHTDTIVVDQVKQYEYTWFGGEAKYSMLYDYGNECMDITGGWSGNFLKNIDNMYASVSVKTAIQTTVSAFQLDENWTQVFSRFKHVCVSGRSDGKNAGRFENQLRQGETSAINLGYDYRNNGAGTYTKDVLNAADIRSLDKTVEYNFHLGLIHDWGSTSGEATVWAIGFAMEDDWRGLCEIAGITAPETAEILATDADSVVEILNNREATVYMVTRCTGEFMLQAVKSSVFLTALGASPYNAYFYASEHWAKFLAMVA